MSKKKKSGKRRNTHIHDTQVHWNEPVIDYAVRMKDAEVILKVDNKPLRLPREDEDDM